MSDSLTGKVINGKYRVLSAIGQGGMGTIYLAEQMALGRTVAVKVLKTSSQQGEQDPQFQRRFFLEASMCAKLSHPNIVVVHDYGSIEGVFPEAFFMAMEYLEGQTLHQRLRERGVLLPHEALSIIIEITRGLREAHKQGMIHRDLKPGNIMLVPEDGASERVKILDFGLVKAIEQDESDNLTRQGNFVGSPKYMSPEQINGLEADPRTDFYSLGVILFQCLTGSVPFDGPAAMQILLAHCSVPVPAMKEINALAQVPEPVEAFARKLLEKNRDARLASPDEIIRTARDLQEMLGYGVSPSQTGRLPVLPVPVPRAPRPALSENPSGTLSATAATVSPDSKRQDSRLFAASMAIGVTGLMAVGIIAWLATRTPASPPHLAVAVAPDAHVGDPVSTGERKVVGTAPGSSSARTEVPVLVNPASVHHPLATPDASVAVAEVAVAEEVVPTEPVAEIQDPPGRTGRGSRGGRRATLGRVTSPAHPATPVVVAPATAETTQEFGFLSFDTTPYSVVSLDGHSLGTTPLVHVRLPTGSHTLRLRNEDQSISTSFTVTIRNGETTSRRIALE